VIASATTWVDGAGILFLLIAGAPESLRVAEELLHPLGDGSTSEGVAGTLLEINF